MYPTEDCKDIPDEDEDDSSWEKSKFLFLMMFLVILYFRSGV